ncbi:hypothetical protein DENSPDRAFT_788621, partial [Dentipellis sp. KUC8613]
MSGWLKPLIPDGNLKQHDDIETSAHSAGKWKSLLASKRQEILAKKEKAADRAEKINAGIPDLKPINVDEVKLVDKKYLCHDFKAKNLEDQNQIDSIVREYTLNAEQERAFRIVANHAMTPDAGQLKMYLGGMAGTGKSQVIKALTCFFERRNEEFKFMILAPTGSAAALVGGSTYHSV